MILVYGDELLNSELLLSNVIARVEDIDDVEDRVLGILNTSKVDNKNPVLQRLSHLENLDIRWFDVSETSTVMGTDILRNSVIISDKPSDRILQDFNYSKQNSLTYTIRRYSTKEILKSDTRLKVKKTSDEPIYYIADPTKTILTSAADLDSLIKHLYINLGQIKIIKPDAEAEDYAIRVKPENLELVSKEYLTRLTKDNYLEFKFQDSLFKQFVRRYLKGTVINIQGFELSNGRAQGYTLNSNLDSCTSILFNQSITSSHNDTLKTLLHKWASKDKISPLLCLTEDDKKSLASWGIPKLLIKIL